MKLTEDNTVRYFTKSGDRLGGPYTLDGLESLVYLQRLSPDDLISREGATDFIPVRESEVGPLLFPKSRQRPNVPEHWAPPGAPSAPADHNRRHYRMTEAKFEKVNDTRKHQRIEVHEILDDIRQSEIAAGFDRVAPSGRFRISKRSRDFWFMLIAGNIVILGGAIYFQNTASIVFGFGGAALYTFGLLWSMYGVMDRY